MNKHLLRHYLSIIINQSHVQTRSQEFYVRRLDPWIWRRLSYLNYVFSSACFYRLIDKSFEQYSLAGTCSQNGNYYKKGVDLFVLCKRSTEVKILSFRGRKGDYVMEIEIVNDDRVRSMYEKHTVTLLC